MNTTIDEKELLKGTIVPGSYKFSPAKDGKKARAVFVFQPEEGEFKAVALFGNAAVAFNNSIVEAVREGEGRIWLEGKVAQPGDHKGKQYEGFIGYKFGKLDGENNGLWENANYMVQWGNGKVTQQRCEFNKEELRVRNLEEMDHSDIMAEVKSEWIVNGKGERFETYQDSFSNWVIDGSYKKGERAGKDYVPNEKVNATADYEDTDEFSHPSVDDIIDVEAEVLNVEKQVKSFLPFGVDVSINDEIKIKAIDAHEFNDDLGKFFESMLNLVGPVAIAAGKMISVKLTDVATGKSTCQELKIVTYSDKGLVCIDHKGDGKVIELSNPMKLLYAPALNSGKDYRVVLTPDGSPSSSMIDNIELKQVELGQKFYKNAIFYRDDNGFLGKTKEETEKLLGALLRGKRVFGDWVYLQGGVKKLMTGSVEFMHDNNTGSQRTQKIYKQQNLIVSDKHELVVNGEKIPVVLTDEIWGKMLQDKNGVKINFGTEAGGGVVCVNVKGNKITLHGQTGAGYLSIDKNLKMVVFTPITKSEASHTQNISDAVVVENVSKEKRSEALGENNKTPKTSSKLKIS